MHICEKAAQLDIISYMYSDRYTDKNGDFYKEFTALFRNFNANW